MWEGEILSGLEGKPLKFFDLPATHPELLERT
jgi:hypothetical protein